jgi:hypothetical protein
MVDEEMREIPKRQSRALINEVISTAVTNDWSLRNLRGTAFFDVERNCSPLIPEEREQGVRRVSRRDEDRAAGQGLTERLKGGTAVQPTCGDDG